MVELLIKMAHVIDHDVLALFVGGTVVHATTKGYTLWRERRQAKLQVVAQPPKVVRTGKRAKRRG
jgi:hypothetical protein